MNPAEVFLGLALSAEKPAEIRVIARPSPVQNEGDGVEEGKLREAIIAGVDEACREAGKHLYPQAVIYVKNSPSRYLQYEQCAKLLARRVLASGGFRAIAPRDKY